MSVQNKTRQLPGAAPVIKAQEKDANVDTARRGSLHFGLMGVLSTTFLSFTALQNLLQSTQDGCAL